MVFDKDAEAQPRTPSLKGRLRTLTCFLIVRSEDEGKVWILQNGANRLECMSLGWEYEAGVAEKAVVCCRCSDTGDFLGRAGELRDWGGCFPRIVESWPSLREGSLIADPGLSPGPTVDADSSSDPVSWRSKILGIGPRVIVLRS